MIKLVSKVENAVELFTTLTLPFELRQKTRLHTQLDNGLEAGLFLPRGNVIRGGDILQSESGEFVKIISAEEKVSTASTSNQLQLLRACYHLGNRHVPVQIHRNWIRYLHDHVLDEMVSQLGLTITIENAPFEPESGAYSNHHHPHAH